MSSQQIIVLIILIVYLVANTVIGLVYGKVRDSRSNLSKENKYFIGGRGMNCLILAMTTMATYTSVSSFVSGPLPRKRPPLRGRIPPPKNRRRSPGGGFLFSRRE